VNDPTVRCDIPIGNDGQYHCICGAYSTKADTDSKKFKNIKSHAQVCKTGYMLLKDSQSSVVQFEEKKEEDNLYFGGVLLPFGDDVVIDDFIWNKGVVFNIKFGIVVCVSCKLMVVNPARHFKTKHFASKEVYEKFEMKVGDLKIDYDMLKSVPAGVAIQGLPVFEGNQCTSCNVSSRSVTFQLTHRCADAQFHKVWLQQVFNRDGTFWFQVVNDKSLNLVEYGKFTRPVDRLSAIIKSNFDQSQQLAKEDSHIHDGTNTKSAFVGLLRWDELIERVEMSLLVEALSVPAETWFLQGKIERLFEFLNNGSIIGLVAQNILFENWPGRAPNGKFFAPVSNCTPYKKTLSCFVVFVLECLTMDKVSRKKVGFPSLAKAESMWMKLGEDKTDDPNVLIDALTALMNLNLSVSSSMEEGIFPLWLAAILNGKNDFTAFGFFRADKGPQLQLRRIFFSGLLFSLNYFKNDG
jgi:hypothetical protein